jgi:hypothetical protein
MTYIVARRVSGGPWDGPWRLFYRGTGNEVFPGMTWATAAAARAYAAAQ